MQKIIRVRKKDAETSSFLGGRPPLIFRLRGRFPRPPAFDAHAYTSTIIQYLPTRL